MTEPILYILMRTDLPSMNAGKAMAQASHASNALLAKYEKDYSTINHNVLMGVENWKKSTIQGFGAVLVLAATSAEIMAVMDIAKRRDNVLNDYIIDPSYPYRADIEIASLIPTHLDTIPRQVNGNQVTLWRQEVTCGYIFGDKESLKDVVGHLKLHP